MAAFKMSFDHQSPNGW